MARPSHTREKKTAPASAEALTLRLPEKRCLGAFPDATPLLLFRNSSGAPGRSDSQTAPAACSIVARPQKAPPVPSLSRGGTLAGPRSRRS